MKDVEEGRYLPNPEWVVREVTCATPKKRNPDMTLDVDIALSTLTDQEGLVIAMRSQKLTFAEMGQVLEVSGTRCRQVLGKALRKMRHPTRLRGLEPYIEGACC